VADLQQRPAATTTRPASPWRPLVWPAFRALWLATLISNTGGWMQDVGASWLMTSLTPSATLIALVQAAESLPIFFLAIPAGALADIVERRLLMLAGNLVSLGAVWWRYASAHMAAGSPRHCCCGSHLPLASEKRWRDQHLRQSPLSWSPGRN